MEFQPSSSGDDKLIIALDFGTTYSGISYCFTGQRDSVPASIEYWPGPEGTGVPKIPTVIRYDGAKSFTWGAQVGRQDGGIVGVKLLLDPSQPRPKYFSNTSVDEELSGLPKPPVRVAADFIGAAYKHAMNEIAKKVSRDYVAQCQKVYVLSVPAVWSDAAKHSTIMAARAAGLSPVQLVKEPEAAALWTAKKLDVALHLKDTFIVCDAGGGTVDLISYEVKKIDPKLKLKELVPGTGGMCGSLGLNRRFESAVRKLVGEEQWENLEPSKAYQCAARQFDNEIKKYFHGDPEEEYFANFPRAKLRDNSRKGLESDSWRMTGNDLMAIFDPIVNDILKLVDKQVKRVQKKRKGRNPNYIFLVGGFGSSQYLRKRIVAKYARIQVLQPPDAWSAIAKGAAMAGVEAEATVTSLSATWHYGVTKWSRYDGARDKGRPTREFLDEVTRVETMSWYINIGDDLVRGKTIRFSFTREFEDLSDLQIEDELYEYRGSPAPVHPPRKGDAFRTNCTLVSDLSMAPEEMFKRRTREKFTGVSTTS
ncbi:hypothetical protein MKX07_003152 [Trichoderma sp. CBMAI-0711]|nr:hypothetical protein MKX07_003152 [Trichoderma sp. CBMAI-0711]